MEDKVEQRALEAYPVVMTTLIPADNEHPLIEQDCNKFKRLAYLEGYHQAEKDVAESFARIIRGNLSGIGNGIQNMFEQLYTDITGEKMYKGFID
jgi:hypothetical protein